MPLPDAPTRKPTSSLKTKANNELLFKGIVCALIGLAVLVSPYFITSPSLQGIVSASRWVGWFALVLGLAFVGLYARRRMSGGG